VFSLFFSRDSGELVNTLKVVGENVDM